MGSLARKLPAAKGLRLNGAEPGKFLTLGSHLSRACICFILKALSLRDLTQILFFFLSLSRKCPNREFGESISLLIVNTV